MAKSQILGLFASPADVEAAVRTQMRQNAPQFGNAANQRLFDSISGIGASFDPRVQRAKQQQEIAKGIGSEIGTSQYYYDLADEFRKRGMLQSAVVAAEKGKEVEKDLMDKATAKYGAISFVQYGSQARNIRKLIMLLERNKDPAKEVVLQRQLEDAFEKGADEVAKREAQEAGSKKKAELFEVRRNDSLNKVAEAFKKANESDEVIFQLRSAITDRIDQINTGFGSSIITGFQAFARALDLTENDSEWAKLSANTQAAQSVIGQLMLKQIKILGTNPSNADREFLMKTLPTMANEPGAILQIGDFMEAKAIYARENARAQYEWLQADEKNTLVNYETPKEIYEKLEKFYRDAGVTADRAEIDDSKLEDLPVPLVDLSGATPTRQPEPPASADMRQEQEAEDSDANSLVGVPLDQAVKQKKKAEPVPEDQQNPDPTVSSEAQSVLPATLTTPGDTIEVLTDQIAAIERRMNQPEYLALSKEGRLAHLNAMSALGKKRTKLQEQAEESFNTAVDAYVRESFPRMPDFAATSFIGNMDPQSKLIRVKNLLTLKSTQGKLTEAERKLLGLVEQKLGTVGQ